MSAAQVWFWLLLALGVSSGCGTAMHRTRPLPNLEAEYMAGRPGRGATPVVATRLYRSVLARSLGARCRMFPSDSQLFDRRAANCGAATAAMLGIARLYLETAASADILPSMVSDGRVRWLDLPRFEDCRP